MRIKSTESHKKYWANRKIDWKTSYFDTWNHPHRQMIIDVLKRFSFGSILEIGCASGPNLYRISKTFPSVKVGGVDISKDAIETAKLLLPPDSILQVDTAENLFFGDGSCDVILTDAALIYVGPLRINKAISEMKRVGRKHIVLVEFHSKNFFERIGIWLGSGYFSYNYNKLLSKHGFHSIEMIKIPEQVWGYPWSRWGYIIKADI